MTTETISVQTPRKAELVGRGGLAYTAFRAALTPRYGVAWLHIGLGYGGLLAVLAGCGWLQLRGVPGWLTVPLGAVAAGYGLAYLHLFIHEAAHFNLARDRGTNDRLANLFVGLIVGMDIKRYRAVHFDHHRYLGTTRDPERTYFDALDWRFILQSLLGVRVLKVLRSRQGTPARHSGGDADAVAGGKWMLLAGAALNLVLCVAWLGVGLWQVALVWLGGMAVMFPFFAAVRQVLEHRGDEAMAHVDYARVDHGPISRMFGNGPLASTLGGAGFNRHLLHHWDPQLPYTRLAEAEAFLRTTAFEPLLRARQTTYAGAFRRLFGH